MQCRWKSPSRVWLFATPWTIGHGILQARIMEWATFSFSKGSSQPRDQTQVSHIEGGVFTSWATREAQEYWSGQPIPSPADLSDPGIELGSPTLQADSLSSYQGSPESESCSVMSDSLLPHGLYSPRDSPGQNNGVGRLSLLQGIFPPRDRTQVSLTANGFFTSWATRKAQEYWSG